MAHRIDGRKLSRKTGPRKALYRNLIVSVLRYEQIKTTEARAKEVRGQVEQVITLAKDGSLAARRRIVAAAAQRAARHRQADQRDRAQVCGSNLGLHPHRQARPPCRRRGAHGPARAGLTQPARPHDGPGTSRRSPERAAPFATAHGSNTTGPTLPASRSNPEAGPSRESWNALWPDLRRQPDHGSTARDEPTPGSTPADR